MRLKYLSQEAIDDIKINFNKYKRHFNDASNEWFIKQFEKEGWIHESKIECKEIRLNMNADFNISDTKNIEILYDALQDLSPSLAVDERLWSGMLFTYFWEYVQYRRKDELESGVERDILNSFFFMRGKKRSCFMNCLARLWWTGYLLYDEKNIDHYEAARLVSERAFSSNIMLLSSSNFMANRELALGVLDCLLKRQKKGDIIGRYHFVESVKYLNCIGGTALLDMMSREDAKELANKRLNKLYGCIEV